MFCVGFLHFIAWRRQLRGYYSSNSGRAAICSLKQEEFEADKEPEDIRGLDDDGGHRAP